MTKSTITREPITHDIKIYPEFFSAVCTGVKRAELRKNDRDYRVGDTLHLMETPRGSCHRTGEFINVKITHIADVGEWMPGYVLLSVELQERRKADSEPVAEVVSIYGDPEAFGEREIRPLVGIQQMPYGTKLYRHAKPAPVIPDEHIPCDLENEWCMVDEFNKKSHIPDEKVKGDDFELNGPLSCYQAGKIDGWNACRAAMLAAALQSPGSEPATVPGTWIPVSERMPEAGGDMIVFTDGIVMSGVSYAKKKGFYIQALEYDDDEPVDSVTHWMPLPAGPQGVKGE